MMTSSKQRKFTFNCLLKDITGSKCCVIKVRQYTYSVFCWYHFQTVWTKTFVGPDLNPSCLARTLIVFLEFILKTLILKIISRDEKKPVGNNKAFV